MCANQLNSNSYLQQHIPTQNRTFIIIKIYIGSIHLLHTTVFCLPLDLNYTTDIQRYKQNITESSG